MTLPAPKGFEVKIVKLIEDCYIQIKYVRQQKINPMLMSLEDRPVINSNSF